MKIPHALVDTIREGRAFLFLGAGASIGVKGLNGAAPPDGNKLGRLIADKFLGGEEADQPLSVIAEFAISETDLVTGQRFVASRFAPVEPAECHELIPTV